MPLVTRPPAPAEPVLRLSADLLTADALRAAVRFPPESAGPGLHLDLSGVRIPTAGGLGGLVRLHRDLRARGGRLVLLNVRPWAFEVFAATRLTEVFDVRAA
ncbi:MAG TPA: STAS domain-containing protein [Gemmataceae bacterium]|nr:STAS domain-containing protein [Gemmataceae bacterium]